MNLRPYHRPVWATRPAVIIASGWSLHHDQLHRIDLEHAVSRCHVVTVNNTAERAPWATVHYFGDYMAVKYYRPNLERSTKGEWVTQDRAAAERWRMTHLKAANTNGISLQRVHINGNSGFQALNVAACFGARRILLVGFDMRDEPVTGRAHWFGQHPKPLVQKQLYEEWIHKSIAVSSDAAALGIDIANCTPDSAMKTFRVSTLEQELAC